MEIGGHELGNKNMTIKLKYSRYTKLKKKTLNKKLFFQLLEYRERKSCKCKYLMKNRCQRKPFLVTN